MTTSQFHQAARVQASLLAGVEKRCLIWMAGRMPRSINSDHLTVLAGLSMLGAGLCYWSGAPGALIGAVLLLAVNWFGDSLDGTLARVRRHERPRYGYYVDHVLDVLSILFIFAGLVLGGHMSAGLGGGFLLAYYLLMIEIALAAHAVGTFRISFWIFGPTELRILLAAGTLRLLWSNEVTIAGYRWLLFDFGGALAIAGLAVAFVTSAVANTVALYRAEPLPTAYRHVHPPEMRLDLADGAAAGVVPAAPGKWVSSTYDSRRG
jgi:archaetidylinositol phosphate synthase